MWVENRQLEPIPQIFCATLGGDPLEFRWDFWASEN